MKNTPIERHLIDETINEFQIVDFSKATIREVKAIASKAEAASGVEFIKMEMGVPGLPPSAVGVKAEIEALQNGIASLYPDINGLSELKKEASNFIKAFINVDLSPEGCVPVTGSMQGTFASFLTCSQCDEKKDTILFIDPGFPVQKQQLVVMGQKFETFDVYDYRGEKLKEKLESYLKKGNISAIIYSNPNNPSWICLKEEELRMDLDFHLAVGSLPYQLRKMKGGPCGGIVLGLIFRIGQHIFRLHLKPVFFAHMQI